MVRIADPGGAAFRPGGVAPHGDINLDDAVGPERADACGRHAHRSREQVVPIQSARAVSRARPIISMKRGQATSG
jgi:hypothetical protein